MINTRVIKLSKKSLLDVFIIVSCQILSMLANVALIFRVGMHLFEMYSGIDVNLMYTIIIFIHVIVFRVILKIISSYAGRKAAEEIKLKLRTILYEKLLRLGGKYTKDISTAEVVQVSTEGVEQLEIYFANYLPQFIYCMIAPLLLFGILSQISIKASFVLFICVPLIPISIIVIQKIAKKLLAKYWGLYADLGDHFLENMQGMTTLKIYGADETYHQEMNRSAENFRKITMKVLSMQLNSIIVMDLIAYGGTSLGIIVAIGELNSGNINIAGVIIIILLAAEFFLPMRLLGSFFHIAMNGMAAADKMFRILDMKQEADGRENLEHKIQSIVFQEVSFAYGEKIILDNISFEANRGMLAIVGISGSGKSTIASMVIANQLQYTGDILINDMNQTNIAKQSLYQEITKVTDKGYIFAGTVKSNLKMAKVKANDEEMIRVLKQVNIWELFEAREGLETMIEERGTNLSGGEKQRVNIARALLKNSSAYIFDEVTSNIDVESEDDIMKVIHQLAKEKIVIVISHRLQNIIHADQILMLKDGQIIESGTHDELNALGENYHYLYQTQYELEKVRRNMEANSMDVR